MKSAIVLFISFWIGSFVFADNCHIRVRVTDFPPQYFQDEQGEWQGLSVELSKILLKEADCTVSFYDMPWARGLLSMKKGDLDMMTNLSITEERKKYMHYVGPQRDESMVLAVHNDSNYHIQSLDDLKKIDGIIAIQNDGFYGEAFDVKMKTDPEFREIFQKTTYTTKYGIQISKDRLDGFIMDRYDLTYKIQTDPTFQDVKIYRNFFIHQNWVYFGFSKKSVSPKWLKQIENAYDRVKRRGGFERILKRFQ
ncbi:MAG: transporter substrate-binding domain-containing protein [SAR324 cluster bacterium]|nr:transporter substrate-binding domain-containing protein [SAR324 cluster bacterium]